MDRRSAGLALLIAALIAALPVRAAPLPLPPEARWTAAETVEAKAKALTYAPQECLAPQTEPSAFRSLEVEVGRAAFRTPALLGGQAARAGLSCASCHENGRGNPNFHVRGLSGAPGTADITSSLFSKVRGDATFNPVPIPDLAGPVSARKIDRDPKAGALEPFLRGLIVEEFDGPPPPAFVLRGLAAYIREIDPAGCTEGPRRRRVEDDLTDAQRAVTLANAAPDVETAALMIAAARSALGRAHARMPGEALKGIRARLEAADIEIAAARPKLLQDRQAAGAALTMWLNGFESLHGVAQRAEPQSLYNERRMRAALKHSSAEP